MDADPGKDSYEVHQRLLVVLQAKLGCKEPLPAGAVQLVRKSYDARPGKRCFTYVVDVRAAELRAAGAPAPRARQGRIERVDHADDQRSVRIGANAARRMPSSQLPVVVVGSGPAGLFAALTLAEAGVKVLLLERGQPVEVRGRDIGALIVRKQLDPNSNLCYGEGGAGTWSDGKLTTRIGRNSDPVRTVLHTLHELGAPQSVLVDGKPHLGTDRLVRILRAFRARLAALGAELRFGCLVEGLEMRGGEAAGVRLRGGDVIEAAAVVLAVGHSARHMYHHLADAGVAITPKPFAMGFRIEHPQELLNNIQYGAQDAQEVQRGKGRIPVADYSLAVQVAPEAALQLQQRLSSTWAEGHHWLGSGPLPPSSAPEPGDAPRGVYSFCMCPGGQIVPTSTTPDALCVNGMSFSQRSSHWANSALVVGVLPGDWAELEGQWGPLAGVELQRMYEREAALRGGGSFVAPVQRVTDFLARRPAPPSGAVLPRSSYRLGVRPAPLHDLYAPSLAAALAAALERFEAQLPGFVCDDAVLHGVETRTSAPLRIERHVDTCESVSHARLYPCGEGAGYAGGIVSAAVDGIRVGEALLAAMMPTSSF